MSHEVKWIDHGAEPQCPSDPEFPNGIDLNVAQPGAKACTIELPYPAKRCGHYTVTCSVCHYKVAITTAGRADDPRSVRVPCKATRQ